MELVMFVGIPASGKSTRSADYRARGYLVLSSDEIRAELLSDAREKDLPEKEKNRLNTRVFETIRKKAAAALKEGRSVVVDATNLSRKRRMSFLEQFRKVACRKVCVLFITPVPVCLERNRNRTGVARVPEAGMQRMLCSFECPNYWEGWDEILPVADETEYRFPFEQARDFDQDNPHHNLTLGEHMAAAARYCEEQGWKKQLQRVAAYHDIGKLYTKRYCNGRGEPTPHAHYLGHDNYGAYLYLTEMCCGKSLSAEAFGRILYETCLINSHMRPLTYWRWTESGEEKDRQLFGESFLSDLIALHRADLEAH